MRVLVVNKILKWCSVVSGGRTYTCQTKEIGGELCFYFKKAWHPVNKYISDHSMELARDGDKVFFRLFRK